MLRFYVTSQTHRKVQAFLLVAILSVSEVRRVSSISFAANQFKSGGSARNAQNLVHGRYDDGPKHMVAPPAAVRALQAAMQNPKLQSHLKLFAEAMNDVLTNPKLQEMARLAPEHLKAILEDPRLSEQSKLLAEQIKALAREPKVQELNKVVLEATEKLTESRYLQKHVKLASKQLSPIVEDTRLRQQSKLFVEQLDTLMKDPKVKGRHLQESVKAFSEQLKAIMETAGLREHSTLFAEHIKSIVEHPEVHEAAKVGSAQLKAIMQDHDLMERVELASEQSRAMIEHPVLQEHSKLFAQSIEAVMTDSDVKERAAAAAKQLDAIMRDPAIHEYSEAIRAHLISQKIDSGPALDFFSLAEVNLSSLRVSLLPLGDSRAAASLVPHPGRAASRRALPFGDPLNLRGRHPAQGRASPSQGARPPLVGAAALAAMVPAAANAAYALSDLDAATKMDPRSFQPVCPASDDFYRLAQTLVVGAVGPESYKEYAPLIAGGLLRLRLEICVLESFFYEAIIPFIKEKGISWVLPLHETVETFLAGVIFAVASNFILIGSTKIASVIFIYADILLGLPLRTIGGVGWRSLEDKAFEAKAAAAPPEPPRAWWKGAKPRVPPDIDEVWNASAGSPGGLAQLILWGLIYGAGQASAGVRKTVEAADTFSGRYLLLLTVSYVGLKFVHYKIFPDFP